MIIIEILLVISMFFSYQSLYSEESLMEGFEIMQISEDTKSLMMGKTIYEDSVINFDDLRYLKVKYFGYDDNDHIGEIIVCKDIAEEVVSIFKELYKNKFPIEKMKLPDYYAGDDEESMRDNNTSGFNDRPISNTHRSYHQFGLAIDINPLYNPFIVFDTDRVEPSNSREFLVRSKDMKGMINSSSICVQIFKKYGWIWGGDWISCKDYQHFEKQGILDIQSIGR